MNLFASRGMLAALVAANACLVLALVVSASPRQAQAAFGGGSFSFVVGQSNGLSQESLYILDSSSGKMWSVICDVNARKLELYGTRDLNKDLNHK